MAKPDMTSVESTRIRWLTLLHCRRRRVGGSGQIQREERQQPCLDSFAHVVGMSSVVLLVVVRYVEPRQRLMQLPVGREQRVFRADRDSQRVQPLQVGRTRFE